jgi:hypothetical protein
MRVHAYTVAVQVEDASALTGIAHTARLHGEMPDEAIIVAIVDPSGKRHGSAWLRLDALGDDRDLQARVIGMSLLDALDRAETSTPE